MRGSAPASTSSFGGVGTHGGSSSFVGGALSLTALGGGGGGTGGGSSYAPTAGGTGGGSGQGSGNTGSTCGTATSYSTSCYSGLQSNVAQTVGAGGTLVANQGFAGGGAGLDGGGSGPWLGTGGGGAGGPGGGTQSSFVPGALAWINGAGGAGYVWMNGVAYGGGGGGAGQWMCSVNPPANGGAGGTGGGGKGAGNDNGAGCSNGGSGSCASGSSASSYGGGGGAASGFGCSSGAGGSGYAGVVLVAALYPSPPPLPPPSPPSPPSPPPPPPSPAPYSGGGGSTTYYVVNQWNGACLDAPSVAQAQANTCNSNTATQKWTLVASSYTGYYQLQNVGLGGSGTSANCLDVSYGTLSNNQIIDVWTCQASNGASYPQQLFTLPPVGAWGSLSVSASGGNLGQSSGFCVDNGARMSNPRRRPSPVTAAAVTRAQRPSLPAAARRQPSPLLSPRPRAPTPLAQARVATRRSRSTRATAGAP